MNLKELGQIGKRLDELESGHGGVTLGIVALAIQTDAQPEAIRLIEQIVARHTKLSDEEKALVRADLTKRIETAGKALTGAQVAPSA